MAIEWRKMFKDLGLEYTHHVQIYKARITTSTVESGAAPDIEQCLLSF